MIEKLLRAKELAEIDPEQSIRLCNEVLEDDFDNAMALFIQGYVLMQSEKFGLAYNLFERCLQLNPHQTEIWNNMGMCLEIEYPERAMMCFDEALVIKPDNHHALINKGLMHLKRGEPEKCVKLCNQALKIDPTSRAAHDNKAQGLLMMREWAQGWDEYTHSWGGKHRRKRDFGLPIWEGQKDARVIVYAEQGLGDEILFASCIPDLQAISKQVIVECDQRLQGVFERSFGVEAFGTRFENRSPITDWLEADYVISIGELPRFFRRNHKSFPGTRYLKPDPERCIQWDSLLSCSPGLKIGLAWTGGLKNTGKRDRSLSLDTFAPLFDIPNTTFVSLEYNEPDLKGYPIKHWSRAVDKSVDHDETLALINGLDLVISVTTTVVHSAGALGKECWCLVPKNPSFRFHLSGEIPWHKSVKLMRQKDSWDDVIVHIKRKLEALC